MSARVLVWLFVALLLASPAAARKRIALSFDDVPRRAGAFLTPEQRTPILVAALKQAGVRQAAFFVNPGNIAGTPGAEARVAAYVAAGHVIANHSNTHPRLGATPVDAYLADVDAGEAWLRGRPGYRPWFRFPFLDEGGRDAGKRDAVRAGLKARGLMNGYVTVDGSDWNMEALTVAAASAGRPIDRTALRDLYVETMVEAAEFYDGLARRTIGRSPAHVLLLHETDLAALYIGDLVKGLRAKGWTIITADEAYRDPIRTAEPVVPAAQGPRTELIAWERGLPAPRWYARNSVAFANRIFEERVMHDTGSRP